MKATLILFVTTIISITLFGQTENLAWVMARDGFSTFEISDVYPDGSIISAGGVLSTLDLDPSCNDILVTSPDLGSSSFIQKLNPDGSLAWANEYKAGSGEIFITGMCIDLQGNAYIAGNLDGYMDFDPTTPGYELDFAEYNIFILSLDVNGNFRWVQKLGDGGIDKVGDITTDNSGNVYLFGSLYFNFTDFDPGAGFVQLPERLGYDSFVEKLTSNGDFIWAKRTLGIGAGDIVVDDQENIYIGNGFTTYAITDAGISLTPGPTGQMVIQKLNTIGEQVWVRKYGNDYGMRIPSLALDTEMNLYCQNSYSNLLNVDPGYSELSLNSTGIYDVFIQKIHSDGTMIWTKNFGGNGSNFGLDLNISPDQFIYSTGSFTGTIDFTPLGIDDDLESGSIYRENGYLAKLNLDGDFVSSLGFGNLTYTDDEGIAIHSDSDGNLILHAHSFGDFFFETPEGNRFVHSTGNHFIAKFGSTNQNPMNQLNIGVSPNPVVNSVSVNQLDHTEFGMLESEIKIRIFDGHGKVIYEVTSNTVFTEIDLTKQGIGTYYIEVTEGDKYFLEKVIKLGELE